MKTASIVSIGTANPDMYLSQREVFEFYDTRDLMPTSQKDLYARLLLNDQIEGGYFALEHPNQIVGENSDAQIERFAEQARKLGAKADRNALNNAGFVAKDVSGLVVNTCTGYLCPGLSSYLAEDLELNTSLKALDIMGMGCGSAVPNLECGKGMLTRKEEGTALCVSIEICSATHYVDDDPGLTVSNCIFGDGAATAILSETNESRAGVELLDFESGLFPRYREALRYKTQGGHLRNNLAREVPVEGASCLREVTAKLLERNNLKTDNIAWWAIHAGGTEVLRQVGKLIGPELLD